ncbi:hypothetical protein SAZ11_47665 [Streptomyces sp. FXJ1.4098]|nr:hypothetical protein [Streptomyces sp. FXJ1.4098]
MPDVDDLAGYVTNTLLGIAPVYRPADMYIGTKLAALTALDSGITTMLDFSTTPVPPSTPTRRCRVCWTPASAGPRRHGPALRGLGQAVAGRCGSSAGPVPQQPADVSAGQPGHRRDRRARSGLRARPRAQCAGAGGRGERGCRLRHGFLSGHPGLGAGGPAGSRRHAHPLHRTDR